MRVARLAVGLAFAGAWLPGMLSAPAASPPSLQQPASATAFETDSYLGAAPQPAGQPANLAAVVPQAPYSDPSAPQPSQAPPAIQDQAGGPAPMEESPAPPASGPWTLPQPQTLKNLGIKVGGWIQQGVTANGWNPADGFNGPNATNDRDGYELNQAWMYFVRPTNTEAGGFDIGGRIDVMYGSDWRFGRTNGLENRYDDPNSLYGLILPQFYFEVAYNDLTVKVGHYASLTSMELVPAPVNFFYSHTLLISGYFDPLLLTGVQGEYKLGENFTVLAGMHDGWLNFEDPEGRFDFLGGVKWATSDKKTTLSVMVDTGPEMGLSGAEHDRTTCWIVGNHQFDERLWWGGQITFGKEDQGSVIALGNNAYWFGYEQELTYKLDSQWSVGLRYEWVNDPEGSRIAGVAGLIQSQVGGWNSPPGFSGNWSDVTLGLNWRPHPNLVVRPEVRYDWYNGAPNTTTHLLPYDENGTSSHSTQFTTAMDMIVTF